MEVKDFTEQVFHLVENLNEDIKKRKKRFSDIVDDHGHQYVDLVMEGGGVLGIALVGFTYVLEQVGIRFLQVGGTSAGAINAMLVAALGTPDETKSEEILEELANVDMYSFVDGDSDARDLVEAWLGNAGKFKLGLKLVQVLDNINDDLGLNPGDAFHKWITGILRKAGIRTTRDLNDRLAQLPRLRHLEDRPLEGRTAGLALVAADVSTQTKAVFPKMASLYWKDPNEVNPADYVRASMSIPFFFHPFRVNRIPRGPEAMRLWKQFADYEQTPPKSCVFIDGGIMSNFPINLFHRPDRIPTAPTFGVKLGYDNRKTEDISKPFALLSAIFDSARLNLDADFIARNQDYRQLVSCIDTDNHNWLNFRMSDKDKIDLFIRGAKTADRFLREFDWNEYKKTRGVIAKSIKESPFPEEMMSGDAVMSTIKRL